MKTIFFNVTLVLSLIFLCASPAFAVWQRDPASDVDKEFISGNPGLAPGVPSHDMSCWLATSANMLAGAGYGNGSTIQARAEDIYLDLLNWRKSLDATDVHGTKYGGWMNSALNWWLASSNNTWTSNPYTVVTEYGSKGATPWSDSHGARFIGNELREYKEVGIAIRWPRATADGHATGGHAITPWGDSGTSANLTGNPTSFITADSDRDNGGDFQTYTYDSFTNPNPSGFDEGNGWYFNFSGNHAYIVYVSTLTPTDSPVDPHDGPTQKVVGSYRVKQDELEDAVDLHYTAYTDYDILAYRTEISRSTGNDPVIQESNNHYPSLTRSDITVDWDLSDNPVPYGKDVTITTEFVLQGWNGIHYDGVYYTYNNDQSTKYMQPPYADTLGTGIRIDRADGVDRVLADDFNCIETGPITKIYLWGSWLNDGRSGPPPGSLQKLHLAIYSDDPVGDDPENPNDDPENQYSKPLELLWEGSFTDFEETEYALVNNEYFWDPYNESLGNDDRVWQYVVTVPEETAFVQQGTRSKPVVYWLSADAEIEGGGETQFGWKTTPRENAWNDTAVALMDEWVSTDAFDYWEDQSTHEFQATGSWSKGTYSCETDSLRLGGCDSGAQASIKVAVLPDTDRVKLDFIIPWSGATPLAGPTGAALYVDGVYQGQVSGLECTRSEFILENMSSYTADGEIEIMLIDDTPDCDGDIQVSYLKVYSAEKSWQPMLYPAGHELHNYPVDMSFGIVTTVNEPGVMFPSFGWNIVTADLENTNIPDISGGYVIGSFDVIDYGDSSKLLGQYRFIHQHPYTKDPERHTFTITPPENQSGCEYVATNFRFGHSWGMLNPDELWSFSDWMTTIPQNVYLCSPDPVQFTLNWEGMLPYPASDITPADQMPESPDCTVYLDADLNKDCCVNVLDFRIMASQWLDCTLTGD